MLMVSSNVNDTVVQDDYSLLESESRQLDLGDFFHSRDIAWCRVLQT